MKGDKENAVFLKKRKQHFFYSPLKSKTHQLSLSNFMQLYKVSKISENRLKKTVVFVGTYERVQRSLKF